MAIHDSAARGFAAGADAYERGRPSYSREAVERLATELGIEPGKRVLDLAAGTGKLTRQLLETGAEIVAVEPIAEMRARLTQALPGVEALDGTAEDIPLTSQSLDAVTVGQGFHWFDGVRAVSEIRRVLRPGGALGMIWQARDPNRPWIERLNEIIDRADDGHPRFRTQAWRQAFELSALFEPIREATYETVQRASHEVIVDRVASISYVASMAAATREVLLEEVRELLASDPDTADRDVVELPYLAHVYWTRVRALPATPSHGLVTSVNVSPGGVPKNPVAHARIRRLGLDGDGHDEPEPLHGGPRQAVCLYAQEAIERVRADGHHAFPGAYGENLTLAGLDWEALRPGGRLRLGSGAVLELTHFVTPCRKQARWFTDGRYGRISAAAHPEDARWYAAVLAEGPVAPGDEIELIRTA